jgi:hypothetical protein
MAESSGKGKRLVEWSTIKPLTSRLMIPIPAIGEISVRPAISAITITFPVNMMI